MARLVVPVHSMSMGKWNGPLARIASIMRVGPFRSKMSLRPDISSDPHMSSSVASLAKESVSRERRAIAKPT